VDGGSKLMVVLSQKACQRYPNVEPIVAYMPEPFGTHHSKMMILLRHDDFAQYVFWPVCGSAQG
jgi:hypothetical protein